MLRGTREYHPQPTTCRQELLAPPVIQIGVQAFAATQGGNALLVPQVLEDDPDLLFDREPTARLPPDVLNDFLC